MTNPSRRDDGGLVADIDRLYCTHCTFGTSVLEKRTTENATRVLGYSVRAASITDREKIRRVFRAIERLLSYDLPKGTPPTAKLTYDAAKAPRRLVFMPRLNDHQVVGLMSYRSQDTAGRPGSYFGDFLVSRTGATPSEDWSAVDCLRLWPATHTGEIVNQWWCDSEERVAADEAAEVSPIAPETLSSVSGPEIISDETFISFLSAEFGTSFEDPGQVIPPRWAEIPAADRQLLFARLAQATVDVLKSGKGTVTLVVEPSLAALLFYGVCRILPQRLLAAYGKFPGLSFSTYDPAPDRATTTLVATVCSGQGVDGELPGEAYKRGFVCNTFVPEFRYGVVSEPGKYVAHVAEFLQRESRIPDEVIREYDALRELSITGIDALPPLADELGRYLHGADRLARYPQLTEEAAGALTPAGKSLRAVLVRKRLQSLSPPYPPDLLKVVVDWLGNELAGDWKAKGPLYQALLPILPSSEKELEDLFQRAGSKLSQDIRDDAVIKVTLANGFLPKTLAGIAVGDKSFSKLGDALCRTIKRLELPAESVEGVLREAIERYPGQYLPIFARHFDVIASVAGIQDRQPLVACLLAKAFPGGPLEPSDKWALLESCVDSVPTPVSDGVWDDPMWREDQIEKAFRGGRPKSDEWRRRATAVERWAGRYDEAKPGSSLARLVPKWWDLIVTVDEAMAKGFDEEGEVRSYRKVIAKASLLDPSPLPSSKAAIECIYLRAADSCGRPDSDVASFSEEMEAFLRNRDVAEKWKKNIHSFKSGSKRALRSAVRGANRYAIPLAASIGVVAVLAWLVVYLPPYLRTVWPAVKQEQAKKAGTQKTPATKANQRQEHGTPPNSERPRPPEGIVATEGSVGTGAAGLQNEPSPGRNDSAPPALPPTGTPTATSPAPGTALTQPNGMPAAPTIFPGAVPGGDPQDPLKQVDEALRRQKYKGTQLAPNVQRIEWGGVGHRIAVGNIVLSLPKADSIWIPDNINISQNGQTALINPAVAQVNFDSHGINVTDLSDGVYVERSRLLPIIVTNALSPGWTWIDRARQLDVSPSIPVGGRVNVDIAVGVKPIYALRNKIVVDVMPRLNGNPLLPEHRRIRADGIMKEEFALPPVAGEQAYPVLMRVQCVDGVSPETIALRFSCSVGYFGVKDGDKKRVVISDGDIEAGTWVRECVGLMKESALWAGGLPPDFPKKLKEAYRELEANASEVVSNKTFCISFLQDDIAARVTEKKSRDQFGDLVSYDKSKNHNVDSRQQSLRAVLQATDRFRQAASVHCGLNVSFPLVEDPSLKEKAKEVLDGKISDVVVRWKMHFLDNDAFRKWCWKMVCSDDSGDTEQIRLLALLWLSLEDSRGDFKRSKQNAPSGSEYLRSVSMACEATLRLEWFPADWGGKGDGVATVTPWFANCTIDMSALPMKAVPSATVTPPLQAPAADAPTPEQKPALKVVPSVPVADPL